MPIKIGELAKRTESTVEAIRYYEKEGLLPEPSRSDGNYRLHLPNSLHEILQILRLIVFEIMPINQLLKTRTQ